jgi:hypothetical protein
MVPEMRRRLASLVIRHQNTLERTDERTDERSVTPAVAWMQHGSTRRVNAQQVLVCGCHSSKQVHGGICRIGDARATRGPYRHGRKHPCWGV